MARTYSRDPPRMVSQGNSLFTSRKPWFSKKRARKRAGNSRTPCADDDQTEPTSGSR